MDKLDKDYVWECDYGIREPLMPILKELLSKQDADSLQMVSLLTNSIPYNLEFYVVVSYDNPQEGHIEFMKNSMLKAGLRYRPDITLDELIKEMGNRRFNAQRLVNANDVEAAMNSESLFPYIEKSAMKKLGYVIDGPLGNNKMPIFLSYSSKDITEVEDFIPFINEAGFTVWFDKLNIDYGESIVESIGEGINRSAGVIFWITNDFINSNWCKFELNKFSSKYISKRNILTIAVVHQDVDMEKIDFLFDDIKYLKRKDKSLEEVAKEIIPALKKSYMNKI